MARRGLLCSLLVILSVESVFCGDDCITYSINENYDSIFTASEGGLCTSLDNEWVLSYYTADVTPPNNRSDMNISPQLKVADHIWSCIRSFTFPMSDAGVVEVNMYTENLQMNVDRVMVTVQVEAGGTFRCVLDSEFESGWKTLRIPMSLPPGIFQGYIILMGKKSANSVILVDSFRYVPPDFNEDNCNIYNKGEMSSFGIYVCGWTKN